MSLTTSCPSCGTLFRVVPDQLRISDGWVRCGRCSQVFDAQALMQQAAPLPPEMPNAVQAWQAPSADIGTHQETAPDADFQIAPETVVEPACAPDDSALPSDDQPSAPQPLAGHQLAPEQALEALLHTEELDEELARSRASFNEEAQEGLEQPGFLLDAQRQEVWARPGVRVALRMGSVLLLLVLGLQVLLQERDRVAAKAPQLQPALRALCGLTGCELGPLRQIESVVVDSSAFTKLRPDVFRLSFVLKNNASNPVAMPAIELSLTDLREQAVVRRVVLPSEFGAPRPVLAAGAEFPANLTLAVGSGTDGGTVTGYRLLAFYP
jgi:predicted Zn finger-like uncharacterized protein